MDIMRRYTQYNVPHEIWTQFVDLLFYFGYIIASTLNHMTRLPLSFRVFFIGYGARVCVIVLVIVK